MFQADNKVLDDFVIEALVSLTFIRFSPSLGPINNLALATLHLRRIFLSA